MSAESEIRRLAERGAITFAEFMEVALYWPHGGYYARQGNIGPDGDFYTAPAAHPAFSAILCVQAYQVWQLLGRPDPFWVVEAGAGPGHLCHDFVGYSRGFADDFHACLRYVCLDRRPAPGLEFRLPTAQRAKVERVAAECVPFRGMEGMILSNELLDSFPVHRVTVVGGRLCEAYVTLRDGALAEELDTPSTPALSERLDSLGVMLAEGAWAEINLSLGSWLEQVSGALGRGVVLTIDYGYPAGELYSRKRGLGTLACYRRHVRTDSPYTWVGEQDMTSHVDFTSVIGAGDGCGLRAVGLAAQREFLGNLGMGGMMARLRRAGLGQRELDANRMGMLDLVRPGGMGEFVVLAQSKGMESPSLWGFAPSAEPESIAAKMPLPLLAEHHTPLLEARYPHTGFDWDGILG